MSVVMIHFLLNGRVAVCRRDPGTRSAEQLLRLLAVILVAVVLLCSPCKGAAVGDQESSVSRKVPEPFEAVSVHGDEVSVWNRRYLLGGNGLPRQIIVNGKEILSAPVRLITEVNGESTRDAASGLKTKYVRDDEASFSAASTLPSSTTNTEMTTTIGFDGLAWFEFAITPKSAVVIDNLVLEIPIRAGFARLFTHHFIQNDNPYQIDALNDFGGGPLPERWESAFTPAVWIGNEEGGIQWLAEDRCAWSARSDNKVIRLVRRTDSTVLSVTIIDKGLSLGPNETYRVRFGLLPTPVKALPTWQRYSQFSTAQAASALQALDWVKSGPDKSRLDKAVEKGLRMVVIHQMWTELQGYPGTFRKNNENALKEFVREAHKRAIKVILYIGSGVSMAAPEWQESGEKTIVKPNKPSKTRDDPPAKSYWPDANRYYSPFLASKINELIRVYDIDGVMLDGHASVRPCENGLHGHGCVRGGRTFPTYPILETRALMRQIYTLFHGGARSDGIVLAHSSISFMPPLAFCDFRWAGEALLHTYSRRYWPDAGKAGKADFYSLEDFRALFLPSSTGIPLIYMPKEGRGKVTVNQMASVVLVHGIMPRFRWPMLQGNADSQDERLYRTWAMWKKVVNDAGVTFHPYWANQPHVRYAKEGELAVSYLVNKRGDMLVLAANLGSRSKEFPIKLDIDGKDFYYLKSSGETGRLTAPPSVIQIQPKDFEALLISGDETIKSQ